MVSAAQKATLKTSWAGINLQAAGTGFYTRLSMHCPEVYAVFNLGPDPRGPKAVAQGLNVMQFVDLCVKHIDDMGFVNQKLEELALRHANYGATRQHFEHAKHCFVSAIADAQGDKFDDAAKDAWRVMYDFIAAGLSTHIS